MLFLLQQIVTLKPMAAFWGKEPYKGGKARDADISKNNQCIHNSQ